MSKRVGVAVIALAGAGAGAAWVGCGGAPSWSADLLSGPSTVCVGSSFELKTMMPGDASDLEVEVRENLSFVGGRPAQIPTPGSVTLRCDGAGTATAYATAYVSDNGSYSESFRLDCVLCDGGVMDDAMPSDLGPSTGGYRYVCIKDETMPDTEPQGAKLDTIQNYTGKSDLYATMATCQFGANADPAKKTCSDASGTKTFCSGDSGYVTLGGPGGWVCGEFAEDIENGHILTPVLCGAAKGEGKVTISVCKEPDPASPTCKPCPYTANGNSCEVAGL